MALENVWRHGPDGEWIQTDATEADSQFKHSVQANSHMFRCYKCFQYVIFVKGTNKTSYFKHNLGDTNKECEDRSINRGDYSNRQIPLDELPLKLVMDGGHAILSVGFPPVSRDEIAKASNSNCCLSVLGNNRNSERYRVDFSRFIPDTTNWFSVSLAWVKTLRLAFVPRDVIPAIWALPAPSISDIGALFDARTGRRIPERGDVQVGKAYYLLRYRDRSLHYYGSDVSIQSYQQDSYWMVYKIEAHRMNDSASSFFFDELHMRLTQQLSDISVLWPPVVQREDVIETEHKEMLICVNGQQDMQTYPSAYGRIVDTLKISPMQRICRIHHNGFLQMICAERFHQTLRCLYVRHPDERIARKDCALSVTDGSDKPITGSILNKPPAAGTLRFLSEVDGSITVSDETGFCYRKRLPAEVETRITDLKHGWKVVVRQAKTIVFELSIAPKQAGKARGELPNWTGKPVPFHSRHAAVLKLLAPESELYERVLNALRAGYIPEDGWRMINRMLEG